VNKMHHFFNESMLFKGFIHKNEKGMNELLMIFEYREEIKLKSIFWTSIHEITNTKMYIKKPIPTIYKWFIAFPDLLYMTDIKDTRIDIPFVLYSLDISKKDDPKKIEFQSVTKEYNLIPPFVFHPKLGMKYFFSNHYLGEYDNTEIVRYGVFITKTLYVLESITDYHFENISDYDSFYFQQNGEPIWAVSSIDFFTSLHS